MPALTMAAPSIEAHYKHLNEITSLAREQPTMSMYGHENTETG
jgi:hypothetical protein